MYRDKALHVHLQFCWLQYQSQYLYHRLRYLDLLHHLQRHVLLVQQYPDSHKILYQLGKNPDNAERILAMPPMQMGIELAKLTTAAPAQKPVSKAPPPLSPVGGAATVEPDFSKMSDDEWFARERARK